MIEIEEKEEWKDIEGYEGLYQISNFGRVKSLGRYKDNHGTLQYIEEKIRKTRSKDNGYIVVDLYKNNKSKTVLVHRLVAKAFIPNPENKATVNHIDGNKHNNYVKNLEWATEKEQNLHYYKYGLKKKESIDKAISEMNKKNRKKVKEVNTGIIYNSLTEASKELNISVSWISSLIHGREKSDIYNFVLIQE